MEKAVHARLSNYLENNELLPHTMFGFRAHLSTHDVLLQLKREVIDPARRNSDRALLSLDLKGAFDNVKHSTILQNLQTTNCGQRVYSYIYDFLKDRTVNISIGTKQTTQVKMGTRGTPQGAVLSPLLFNIALRNLPPLLNQIQGIRHALYADDITIWTTRGSMGMMEEQLQTAATTVQNYARACGLTCSPEKCELLVFRQHKNQATIDIHVDNSPIKEVQTVKILGLCINNKGNNHLAIQKLRLVSEQVGRMIARITTRKSGMREEDTLRLVQAFVVSRIVYAAPYLRLKKFDIKNLDVIIRTAYKKALGLPLTTSTDRLLRLGVHNTVDELIEAHLTAQVVRLSTTLTGRQVLNDLNINCPEQLDPKSDIPASWRGQFKGTPLPRNMHPDFHQPRRQARAEAIKRHYGGREGVFYVDAAGPEQGMAAVAVVHQDKTVDGLILHSHDTLAAEEVAIALAATHTTSEYILTDSQTAYRNYLRGRIAPLAAKILQDSYTRGYQPMDKHLVWVPGHQGIPGNESAHASARAFLPRAPNTDLVEPPIPLLTYTEILQHLRLSRRVYPPPAKTLDKGEEIHLRKLQTNTFNNPRRLHAIDPESFDSQCKFCGEKADLYHMVWACQRNQTVTINNQPTQEGWEAALTSSDARVQKELIGRARTAAYANGVPD